jgi:phosphate/sulfate permease
VSTTHIVTSGIAIAWVFTLPVTILVAGGLYYLLASPRFN